MVNRFILLLATGFGAGNCQIAPGTAGTLIAIPVYYALNGILFPFYEITLIAFFFLSVWVSENAEISFGRRDDPRIVIDEIIGFLIAMLWLPQTTFFMVIIGFFIFRFFDIFKPFPIWSLQKGLRGGYGVVIDDVIAGIYTNIVLRIIERIFS